MATTWNLPQVMQIKSVLSRVVFLSLILNCIWEFSHVYLYTVPAGRVFGVEYPWFLLIATMWDVIIVVGLYVLVAICFREWEWYKNLEYKRVILFLCAGLCVAVFIELRALHQAKWGYTEYMPIVPLLRVGLSPVLQMLILPLLVIFVLKKTMK